MDFLNNPFFKGTSLGRFFGVADPQLNKTLHATQFPEDVTNRAAVWQGRGAPYATVKQVVSNMQQAEEAQALEAVRQEMQAERDGLLNRRMHEDIPIVDTGFKPRREVTNKTATVGSDRIGEGDSRTFTKNGKTLANVTAEQLSASGMSLRGYMNAWKQFGQRPTPERMREWFK